MVTYFDRWQRNGVWKQINDTLRKTVRIKQGITEEASAAIIDLQSVKTIEKGGCVEKKPAKISKAGNDTEEWRLKGYC